MDAHTHEFYSKPMQAEVGAKATQLERQGSDLQDRANENIRLQKEQQTLRVCTLQTFSVHNDCMQW